MHFEIKHRFTGAVLFALETDSLRLCVEAAIKSGSDLSCSNLRGSDLRGSDLSCSNLRGAHLQDTHGQKLTLLDDHAVLQLGPLGSRSDYLIAFRTDRGPWLRAGCFWGDLAAFKAAVEETHGAAKHGDEYRAAVAFIEAWNATWTAKTETR